MSDKYELLTEKPGKFFEISFGKFAFAIVSLPFLAFAFCVTWSLMFFFERSTSTHCGVSNYLPSISAAIGNYQPQRFVWQVAILLHAFPRFLVALQYVQHYKRIIRNNRRRLVYVACFLNIIENVSLIGLSLWTSSEDYKMHKLCFIAFIATSEMYMFLSFWLNEKSRKSFDSMSTVEKISLKCKKFLCATNVLSFMLAAYFFGRHNNYCEPGVYTLFALTEYIVVLTNMAYHMTAYWDFNDKVVTFDMINGFHMTSLNQYNYNRLNY